jgi:hypothetical protein
MSLQEIAMRTTIDLPEDLHHIATALARATERSLSQTVTELIRRGLRSDSAIAERAASYQISADTGLPLFRSTRFVTCEDVKALDDES